MDHLSTCDSASAKTNLWDIKVVFMTVMAVLGRQNITAKTKIFVKRNNALLFSNDDERLIR